ncbi:hypothetical protein SDC9_153180 [bioreactor metagenome]|uniref:Uncharacterized protein n=1 Tax=bioreactor metagenome TaxID=1076179 RepID=A0A645EWW6_9ZZZZ
MEKPPEADKVGADSLFAENKTFYPSGGIFSECTHRREYKGYVPCPVIGPGAAKDRINDTG